MAADYQPPFPDQTEPEPAPEADVPPAGQTGREVPSVSRRVGSRRGWRIAAATVGLAAALGGAAAVLGILDNNHPPPTQAPADMEQELRQVLERSDRPPLTMPAKTTVPAPDRAGDLRFQPQEFWRTTSHNVAGAPEGTWVTFVKIKVTNLTENGTAVFRMSGQKLQASTVAVPADTRLSYGLPGGGTLAEVLPGKSVYPVLAFVTERKPAGSPRLTLTGTGGGEVEVAVSPSMELPLRAHPDRSGR